MHLRIFSQSTILEEKTQVSALVLHPSSHLPLLAMMVLLCRSYSPCSEDPLVLTAKQYGVSFQKLEKHGGGKRHVFLPVFSLTGFVTYSILRFLFAMEANLIMIIFSKELSENEGGIAFTCTCSWVWHRGTGQQLQFDLTSREKFSIPGQHGCSLKHLCFIIEVAKSCHGKTGKWKIIQKQLPAMYSITCNKIQGIFSGLQSLIT